MLQQISYTRDVNKYICIYFFLRNKVFILVLVLTIKKKEMANIKCPKDKDELIVRQSQMERAIELYTLLGVKPTIQEVCRLSQILTEFVFTWDTGSEDLKKFSKHIKSQLKQQQ